MVFCYGDFCFGDVGSSSPRLEHEQKYALRYILIFFYLPCPSLSSSRIITALVKQKCYTIVLHFDLFEISFALVLVYTCTLIPLHSQLDLLFTYRSCFSRLFGSSALFLCPSMPPSAVLFLFYERFFPG